MKWDVHESRETRKALRKAQPQIVNKYNFWKDMMQNTGPQAVRAWRGFRDEALSGKWEGFRSSRLNDQFRVIYRIERQTVSVFVEQIDPHTYR